VPAPSFKFSKTTSGHDVSNNSKNRERHSSKSTSANRRMRIERVREQKRSLHRPNLARLACIHDSIYPDRSRENRTRGRQCKKMPSLRRPLLLVVFVVALERLDLLPSRTTLAGTSSVVAATTATTAATDAAGDSIIEPATSRTELIEEEILMAPAEARGELFYGNSTSVYNEWGRRLSSIQPRIFRVGTSPWRGERALGSLNMPEGSPWCGTGSKTFWFVGHELRNERAWCQPQNGGKWFRSRVELDYSDALNENTGRNHIDRHACVHVDVNRDGLPDIACAVGAKQGTGRGYNELYLTNKDGTIRKVRTHGLQKYPSLRTRLAAKLKRASGADLIFIGTQQESVYGRTNSHRMFRAIPHPPYFKEVRGPWYVINVVTLNVKLCVFVQLCEEIS